MRFDTVIRNGTVVTATDTCLADVGINGDKVTAIAAQLPTENATRIQDATGCLIIPGGIDVHTHLDMPFGGTTSADDFQTGTIAAAFGGTTTLIDFAIQYKGQTLRQAFDTWMKKAHDKAVTDYSFHCIITDLGSAQLEEMGQLIREGVTSFKLFMAYPGVFMLDDATIFKAMRQAAKHNGLICMHAENGGAIDVIVQQALAEGKRAPKYHALTRPTTAEAEATSRAIALAEMAGAPVYIGGVHGKHFSPNRFVQLVATAPAKLFGLYPRKGTIAVGSDADLVIFDPNHEEVISAKTHHMRVDYSMFEGIKIKGAPKTVFSRGRAVVDAGKFVGRPGAGQFLRRQTYAGLS